MRILVLQLARFGDIYQTWPTLLSLKRQGFEVHLVTRERFQAATEGLEGVHLHCLPTAHILEPIYLGMDSPTCEAVALTNLEAWLKPLAELQFDRVINLSFSPLSSYLTDILSGPTTMSAGYTRHEDGYLAIPDDTSAYFYAQVGIGRANRYHLTEIFAAIAQVELLGQDRAPLAFQKRNQIVVHLGASQVAKTYSPELWIEALKSIQLEFQGEIVLIGSQDERALSVRVQQELKGSKATGRIKNLTGQTRIPDLLPLIGSAQVLIGADSAPIHIASLVGTKVLNLSSKTVNFWETGPLTEGSRILYAETIDAIAPQAVSSEALALINGANPTSPCFVRNSQGNFETHGLKTEQDFSWSLIEALYTGTPYPQSPNFSTTLAFQRLFELSELAITQLHKIDISNVEANPASQILANIDELLEEIPRLNAEVIPLTQWFQTQRLRLKPGPLSETLQATLKLFEELLWITAVYHQPQTHPQVAIALCAEIAPHLREYEFTKVEPDFQRLMAALQDLARHQTKVGDRPWSLVLEQMNLALDRRDYIELADQLEFELKPQLQFAGPDVLS